MKRDSPFRHCQRRRTLPLELTIHENPVLPIALQIELLLLEQDLHVRPRDEGGVAEVDVDVPLRAAVPPDHHPRLSDTVFELFALDLCDRTLAHVLRTSPTIHHLLGGVLGALLESQQGPRVRLGVVLHPLADCAGRHPADRCGVSLLSTESVVLWPSRTPPR